MKKNQKGKKERVVAEKYENDQVSSDDEMPEVVSNATMKSNQEQLEKELEHLKQQLRHAEKVKRRHKQEMFIAQKKKKVNQEEEDKESTAAKNPSMDLTGASKTQVTLPPKTRATKKVYSSLNITVEPLTKIHDSRATAALNFKSIRLANVPRESVKTAVISYQKKLSVRKQV